MTPAELIRAFTALVRTQPMEDAEVTIAEVLDDRLLLAALRLERLYAHLAVAGRLVDVDDRRTTWN